MRYVLTLLILTGMWIVLSGKFDALHLGSGLATAVALSVLCRWWRGPQAVPVWRLLAFVPRLTWWVMRSNLHVAGLVLSRRMEIAPRMVKLPPGVRGDHALTLLGCAVTLTPGTVMIEITPDHMTIHTLDGASIEGILTGQVSDRVRRVFDDSPREAQP